MRKLETAPQGFFFPSFEEMGYTIEPMAIHPLYSLKDYEYNPVITDRGDPKAVLMRYGWGLFDKLTELETYDYHPLMTYHLEYVQKKWEWLNNFILLIALNKDLFIAECGVGKYIFLFEMVMRHYSVFNDAFMSSLTNDCEDCRSRIITNIKRDEDLLRSLDSPEKEYLLSKMERDFIKFKTFWNMKIEPSKLEEFNALSREIDHYREVQDHLKENAAKRGPGDLSGFKQITANCTTTDCAKYVSEFLTETTDDNGNYVFDFNNSSLADWLPLVFHCTKGKAITANSYRDKLPSVEAIKRKRSKKAKRG